MKKRKKVKVMSEDQCLISFGAQRKTLQYVFNLRQIRQKNGFNIFIPSNTYTNVNNSAKNVREFLKIYCNSQINLPH